MRDYAHREGVPVEEMLPTPLRLRREIERLAQTAGEFRSEAEVREAAADLNRRIVEWRRIPVGPPVHVRLVNADDLVARWRKAPATRVARTPPGPGAAGGTSAAGQGAGGAAAKPRPAAQADGCPRRSRCAPPVTRAASPPHALVAPRAARLTYTAFGWDELGHTARVRFYRGIRLRSRR